MDPRNLQIGHALPQMQQAYGKTRNSGIPGGIPELQREWECVEFAKSGKMATKTQCNRGAVVI